MAFKVGEYVTSKERPELGKGRITDEVDFNQYIVKFGGGAQDLFEGSDLVAANACAKNGIRSTNAAVNAALNGCKARNAWGDESQVNGLITKMLGLIKQIKPIAGQLYDTAFELDDAGSVWLDKNKDSKNVQKVREAVSRAKKVMNRLGNFVSGLDF